VTLAPGTIFVIPFNADVQRQFHTDGLYLTTASAPSTEASRTQSIMASQAPVIRSALKVKHEVHGVVVSAGLMQNTVKVRIGGQKWNNIVKKTFSNPKDVLVHDANSSIRQGDVVAIAPGWRTSKTKRYYVKQIIAPYGVPIEDRPPVLPLSELFSRYEAKRLAKAEREHERQLEQTEKSREANRVKAEKLAAKLAKREAHGKSQNDANVGDTAAA
jgi:small subunit ribosomal protein S17